MAVQLLGPTKQGFVLRYQLWYALLDLAQNYGWQPQGTRPGAGASIAQLEGWDGTYLSTADQVVDAADARQLATALRRALDDIPDHDALQHKSRALRLPFATVRVVTTPHYSPIELLSGANKALVLQLIDLCDHGPFWIGSQELAYGH